MKGRVEAIVAVAAAIDLMSLGLARRFAAVPTVPLACFGVVVIVAPPVADIVTLPLLLGGALVRVVVRRVLALVVIANANAALVLGRDAGLLAAVAAIPLAALVVVLVVAPVW